MDEREGKEVRRSEGGAYHLSRVELREVGKGQKIPWKDPNPFHFNRPLNSGKRRPY